MPTIEEMNSKMTIFYSKSTGEIKNYCTGIQSMATFGVDEADFSLIWDFVVLDIDQYVINNRNMFRINLDTRTLEMKAEFVPQYPIAPE